MNSYYRFMETSLDMLKNSTISEEDSRLVDSILNELNSNDKEPQHLTQPPQINPSSSRSSSHSNNSSLSSSLSNS